MIKAEEFKRLWKEDEWNNLVSYEIEEISEVPFNDRTKEFLTVSGLPSSCAPFLSFNQKIYYPGIRNIKEEYELSTDEFNHYYTIGSSDNVSICIDINQEDQIYQIDYDHISHVENEDEQDYHEEFIPIMFMNTSIAHLAHCLLVYRKFVENARAARNDESFLNIQPDDEELNKLKTELQKADENCLNEKSFWWFEFEGLKHRC